jgi:outer membrane lipoprotein-sorting protein
MRVPTWCATVVALVACALPQDGGAAQKKSDLFDELYAKGRGINDSMRTLTARFTEATTSALLTKPLVSHGDLAFERPDHVILRYAAPDSRTVLIDGSTMTIVWPSQHTRQTLDIGTAQGRIRKYFVNGTVDDLRREFDITAHAAAAGRGDYEVEMLPKRKQIRESLVSLGLRIDRGSLLLAGLTMTFANGDTKTMTFDGVALNAPLASNTFTISRD